jgi:hypothetical protein
MTQIRFFTFVNPPFCDVMQINTKRKCLKFSPPFLEDTGARFPLIILCFPLRCVRYLDASHTGVTIPQMLHKKKMGSSANNQARKIRA